MTKSQRIQILPLDLANQIAAGEVIERPASVVKELIENSLDAGAHALIITLEQSGMGMIRVQDDGYGIHPEDMALALSRHATSKVASFADLNRIRSLGFRGEALASISSVAHFELQSRRAEQEVAWKLTIENQGALAASSLTPCAHPQGTTAIVRNLFFNVPARRKFLRSEHYELSQIEEIVKRLALSRFDVAIALTHGTRNLLHLPLADQDTLQLEKRVAKIFGKIFLEQALAIDIQNGDMRLWGWLGLPSFSRSSVDLQYFYLNGRIIRDRLINHAIRAAYAESLPAGRSPGFILYLEMEPSLVDVNVHPTKHEVRFRESRLIHDFILSSVEKVVAKEQATSTAFIQPVTEPLITGTKTRTHHVTEQLAATSIAKDSLDLPLMLPKKIQDEGMPLGRALGIVHEQFLVAENNQGMVIIDLPAIYRWLNSYHLKQAYQIKQIKKRLLLIPQRIKIDKKLIVIVEEQQARLDSLGWEINCLDTDTLLVRQAPGLLTEIDFIGLIPHLLALIQRQADDEIGLLDCMADYSLPPQDLSITKMNDLLREIERISIDHPRIKLLAKENIPELFK